MVDAAGPHRSGQAHTIRPTRESGVRRQPPIPAAPADPTRKPKLSPPTPPPSTLFPSRLQPARPTCTSPVEQPRRSVKPAGLGDGAWHAVRRWCLDRTKVSPPPPVCHLERNEVQSKGLAIDPALLIRRQMSRLPHSTSLRAKDCVPLDMTQKRSFFQFPERHGLPPGVLCDARQGFPNSLVADRIVGRGGRRSVGRRAFPHNSSGHAARRFTLHEPRSAWAGGRSR